MHRITEIGTVEEDSKDEEAILLQESREAVIAESMNKLNGGVEESEVS